jgi:hypothetical protein
VLNKEGFLITELKTSLTEKRQRTTIVYDSAATETALSLSQRLNEAPLSAFTSPPSDSTPIIIYLGKDVGDALVE